MGDSEQPGRPLRPPTRWLGPALAVLLIVLVVTLGAAVALRNTIARTALHAVGGNLGYDITSRNLDVNLQRAVIDDLHVANAHGEPVLTARHIAVDFSLRDLLPGGKRLFGLESVAVDGAHVTVIHHPDGTYNITVPQSSGQPQKPSTAILDVRVAITDASVDLIDRFVAAPNERRARLVDVALNGGISSAVATTYRGGAVFVDGGKRYPIAGTGRFADARGFEFQHWTAARLPIATLANFALGTHAISVQGGELVNLDAKLGALANAAGTMQTHIGVSADLTGGRVAATALNRPVRDAHGSLVIDDDSATVRNLDATVGGLPLHVRGALYHLAAPQVRFALTVSGDLARARTLSKDIARLPIAGAIRLQALAEGPASAPLVFARFSAPRINYGTYRLDASRGFVAVSGQELDLLAATSRYGGVGVGARATLQLTQHTPTQGYATLTAPPHSLPYVDTIVPDLPLVAAATVRGADGKLAARGQIGGASSAGSIDAPFSVDATGSGSVGPVALERRDGASVYARVILDRPANRAVAIADIHRLTLLPAPAVTLPGITLPPAPRGLDATLDASVAALAAGTTLASANGFAHAYGSWGDLRADAAGTGRQLAASGRLTSSFERLRAFTGNVGAHGGIDIPFAATNNGGTTIVQVSGARFPGAAIRGIALDGMDATLGVRGSAVDVYAAALNVAGRRVTAQGSFGNGGRIHITAGDIDLAQLRALGSPLTGGNVTVIANVGGTPARPVADLLAALGGASYAGTPVGGDVGLAYDGSALHLDRATVTYGGAYADATGAVSGLTPGHIAPRYDLHARLSDADIATLARTVKNPLRYPQGTVNADMRVAGSGSAPTVNGDVQIPEGSLNGLNFRDGRIGIAGSMADVAASDGRLTVGGTRLRFSGNVSRVRQSANFAAQHVDLADFNDYFDEAEVLAGTGRADLAVTAARNRLGASANVALDGVRVRRFALGSVSAVVRTSGTNVRVRTRVAGVNGRASLTGTVGLPGTDPTRDIVRRSYVDMDARIAGIDLGNVLPAAGLSVPLLGVIDGSAVVRGRYPALALTTRASLANGIAGRVPIQRFTIAATASNGHGRLTDLTLVAPGLTAGAGGTFGLRPQDAFDLTATVSSPDISTLAKAATGKTYGVTGSLDTRLHATGTTADPRVNGSVDARNIAYNNVTVPGVHTDFNATRQAVDIRNGSVTLQRGGTVAFDGRAPLTTGPATPISFDFAPHNVDVSPYSSALPDGAVLTGVFNGNVAVRGTLAAPLLNGNLGFTRGSFHSKTLTGPLTAIALQLNFARTTISIAQLHAHAAPGDFDGTGTIALGDLRDPVRGLRANVNIVAANAHVAAPKFYTGAIDGTLTATKNAGSPLTVGGDLTFSTARIPYTALTPSGGGTTGSGPALPAVAFDLGVNVARDVRIQSGPVDIGTRGSARLGGTLAKPTLDGQFTATDGTVSVYRTFVVQNGSTVSFSPSEGTTPNVDATAVTHVPDPATDVLLHVTGLATHLNLAFSSQPSYSQEQILGLLVNAQALGAVSGVAQTSGTSGGSSAPSVTGIGEGFLNEQFTQKFLQPFSSKVGGALGLSDLNVNYSTTGAVSATARRTLGKNISFVYGEQIGGPSPRTSLGINIGTAIAGAQLTFYQAASSNEAFGGQSLTPYLQSGFLASSPPNYTLQAIQPPNGSGFVFSYQRKFW